MNNTSIQWFLPTFSSALTNTILPLSPASSHDWDFIMMSAEVAFEGPLSWLQTCNAHLPTRHHMLISDWCSPSPLDYKRVYLFSYREPCPPKSYPPAHYLCCAKCSTCYILKIGNPTPKTEPISLKFKRGLDLCTVHLSPKFHHPMFNRSKVIMFTKKWTNIDSSENIHLSFTTLCPWRTTPISLHTRKWDS